MTDKFEEVYTVYTYKMPHEDYNTKDFDEKQFRLLWNKLYPKTAIINLGYSQDAWRVLFKMFPKD